MRTLFLDLASHQGFLLCVDGDGVVGMRAVDHRVRDDELLPRLQEVLHDAGWEMNGIQRIACIAGPGGFTSLRVAAALVNALAHALGVPVAGVHLSDLYAARMAGDVLWLHSTKKQELFVRGLGTYAKAFPDAQWMTLADLLAKLPEGAPWTGELILEHEAAIEQKGAKQAKVKQLEEVLPAFVDSLTYEKKTLEPWYGRSW